MSPPPALERDPSKFNHHALLTLIFGARSFHRCALRELPQYACCRHRKEFPPGHYTEHHFAADLAFLPERHQVVEQSARNLRPEFASHMQIRLEAAVYRLLLEAQRVGWTGSNPIVDVGAELKDPSMVTGRRLHFHGKKGHIVDNNPNLLHGSNQEILLAFPFEHRGEQLDQGQPPDRRLLIEPCSIGRDPHVDVTAEGWIPEVDGWRTPVFAGQRCRQCFQTALPCLRHCFPSIIGPPHGCSHLRDWPARWRKIA